MKITTGLGTKVKLDEALAREFIATMDAKYEKTMASKEMEEEETSDKFNGKVLEVKFKEVQRINGNHKISNTLVSSFGLSLTIDNDYELNISYDSLNEKLKKLR